MAKAEAEEGAKVAVTVTVTGEATPITAGVLAGSFATSKARATAVLTVPAAGLKTKHQVASEALSLAPEPGLGLRGEEAEATTRTAAATPLPK